MNVALIRNALIYVLCEVGSILTLTLPNFSLAVLMHLAQLVRLFNIVYMYTFIQIKHGGIHV